MTFEAFETRTKTGRVEARKTAFPIPGVRRTGAVAKGAREEKRPSFLSALKLDQWRMGEELPSSVTPETLRWARTEAEAWLRPAEEKAFVGAVRAIVAFGRAFNLPAPLLRETVAFYRATLSHVPDDLLCEAVRKTLSSWVWGNRLPMPGDLLRCIEPELSRRQFERMRLETAAMALQRKTRFSPLRGC